MVLVCFFLKHFWTWSVLNWIQPWFPWQPSVHLSNLSDDVKTSIKLQKLIKLHSHINGKKKLAFFAVSFIVDGL